MGIVLPNLKDYVGLHFCDIDWNYFSGPSSTVILGWTNEPRAATCWLFKATYNL